ncbi:MAG: hypothetical protein JO081_02090 [Alphaproteobacteria bacterium]|nr:hypothetical protein [Alphaproteobacteria bacterium]
MITKDVAGRQTVRGWPPMLMHDAAAARIVAELDDIVAKPRPRPKSGFHRRLRKFGAAFGNWLERLVPPAPLSDSSELSPEIRFPFF